VIEFHADARQELRHAARYYERQVAGVGFAFTDEVERTLKLIPESPGIGFPVRQHYRRVFGLTTPVKTPQGGFTGRSVIVSAVPLTLVEAHAAYEARRAHNSPHLGPHG